jgi:hypothetical protein
MHDFFQIVLFSKFFLPEQVRNRVEQSFQLKVHFIIQPVIGAK